MNKSISLVMCCFLIAAVGCGGEQNGDADYVARGKAALAEPEPDATTAYIELKNALRDDPQSAEARWLLGKLYVDVGSSEEALKELAQAEELGWPVSDVRPTMARALTALQRYDDILALDTESLDPEAAAEVLAAQSMAALGKNDMERARQLAQQAQQANPEGSAGAMAEASITISSGDQAAALKILQDLVDRHPEHARAWYLLALNQLSVGRRNAALSSLDRAIELQPQWVEPRTSRALTYLQLKQADKARQDTDALIELAPANPNANYVLGLQLLAENNYDEVIVAMDKAQPLAERYPRIDYALGKSHLILGNHEQAQEHAQSYFPRFPDDVEGRRLLAAVEILSGNYADAEALLLPVLDQNPSDREALALMAFTLAHNGELARSFALYSWQRNLSGDLPLTKLPPNAEVATAAITGHGQGEPVADQPEDRLIEIINLLADKDYSAAENAALEIQWNNTSELSGHHILARVHLSANQPDKAIATLKLALARDKHDPTANIIMGDIHRIRGDIDTARTYYSNSLEEHPYHLQTLLRLASLERQARRSRVWPVSPARPDAAGSGLAGETGKFRSGHRHASQSGGRGPPRCHDAPPAAGALPSPPWQTGGGRCRLRTVERPAATDSAGLQHRHTDAVGAGGAGT